MVVTIRPPFSCCLVMATAAAISPGRRKFQPGAIASEDPAAPEALSKPASARFDLRTGNEPGDPERPSRAPGSLYAIPNFLISRWIIMAFADASPRL
jgi:hypothetical protein